MFYHEIFASIQGEGYDTGIPTVFVRLYGCNVKCAYCDQPQKSSDSKRISVERLVTEIRKVGKGITHICITGGEPLLQSEIYSLMYELHGLHYNISVETNGTVKIEEDHLRSWKYVMDVKTPSSGVEAKNHFENLKVLHSNDEVKFVIANRVDYDYMKQVLNKYPTKAKILLSPMFDKNLKPVIGNELVQWILEDRLTEVKVQLQIHKFLNVL